MLDFPLKLSRHFSKKAKILSFKAQNQSITREKGERK